jgi:hypothetical protein
MEKVDEALAAATGGEVRALETIGDVICVGIAACELAADWQRIEQWGQVFEGWITAHNHVAVLGFCYACCAEMFIASGQWELAEGMLTEGLGAMQAANLRGRCVHPAAKLAELRLSQGRIEEAQQLLAGFEELPEATHALASLHLAREERALAAAVLHRRLNAVGDDNVLAAPFLALLVDVQLEQGDADGADATAARLEGIAGRSSLPRIVAMAEFARGRVLAAAGTPDAPRRLVAAMSAFAAQHLSLDQPARVSTWPGRSSAPNQRLPSGGAHGARGVRAARRAARRGCSRGVLARSWRRRTDGPEKPGVAQPARAGGALAPQGGAHERRDRCAPLHQHENGRAPREQHPGQAAAPGPGRGRRLRPSLHGSDSDQK